MEKICRNCKRFKYHRFAGYCFGKGDTWDVHGECPVCDKFEFKTEKEMQDLIDYENNVMKKFFNQK